MSLPKTNNTEVLITLLVKLLDNKQKKNHISINLENTSNKGLDLLYILVNFFDKVNFIDFNDFVFIIQLDLKKLEIYKQTMNSFYI